MVLRNNSYIKLKLFRRSIFISNWLADIPTGSSLYLRRNILINLFITNTVDILLFFNNRIFLRRRAFFQDFNQASCTQYFINIHKFLVRVRHSTSLLYPNSGILSRLHLSILLLKKRNSGLKALKFIYQAPKFIPLIRIFS